jgi:ABC-type lipoprotein export system ATPase subunit
MLLDIHKQAETILIVVTHSKELASRFPQRFELTNQHLEPR